MMKISVTGGKGGTGKSTVATNIAYLLSRDRKIVLVDADVECPNDHILMSTELAKEEPAVIFRPRFEYSKCTKCRMCKDACPENAIVMFKEGYPFLIPTLCSGCRTCQLVCKDEAIKDDVKIIGSTFVSKVNANLTLVSGVLREGEERSYPLVLSTRKRAETINSDIQVFDTSAGTGNHVAAALRGSELAVVVTEPTPLGVHDLNMIMNLLRKLEIRGYVVVNRSDLVSEIPQIDGAEIIGEIPLSNEIVESYIKGRPVVEIFPDSPASVQLKNIAERLGDLIRQR